MFRSVRTPQSQSVPEAPRPVAPKTPNPVQYMRRASRIVVPLRRDFQAGQQASRSS